MQPAPQEISTCSNCGGVLEETPGGGLGLHLIRYAFDQVDYVHKRRGTELVLTKKLE